MTEQVSQPQEQKERPTIESHGDSIVKDGKDVNEDAVLVDDNLGLYGVFDGMGGHDAGEVASATAMQECVNDVSQWDDFGDDDVRIFEESLGNVVTSAHQAVLEKADGSNMGTTASIVKTHEMQDGRVAAGIATVGDSPVYVWRGATKELQLHSGPDDTIVNDNWANIAFGRDLTGEPPSQEERDSVRQEVRNAQSKDALSEPAQFLWNRRNVIHQALGDKKKDIKPHTAVVYLEKGDKLLILSDGVSDNMPEEDIARVLAGLDDAASITNVLTKGSIAAAREGKQKNFRAKMDDTSAVAIVIT